MSERDHIEKLIKTHTRRLQVLEDQKAAMGLHTPPHIVTEIENIKEEIEKLQAQLSDENDPVASKISRMINEDKAEPEREIFISYAWGGESEEIVNQLDAAFQAKGITIVRDKRDLGFKGRIKEFMERIGRGKWVIVVISQKYLQSENCMFELVQIAKNGRFYDRIFPIVLGDTKIYDPTERIEYVEYWEEKIEKLNKAMQRVNQANLQGFREDIDLYTEIRATIAELTNTLKDMNTLTPDMHTESGFAELFAAIEGKMAE